MGRVYQSGCSRCVDGEMYLAIEKIAMAGESKYDYRGQERLKTLEV